MSPRPSLSNLLIAAALSASGLAFALLMSGCGEVGYASTHVQAEDPVGDAHGQGHYHDDLDASRVATHRGASSTDLTEPLDAAAWHAMLHDIGVDPQAPCVCDVAQTTNGWCRQCGHGFLAGLKVDSGALFEALDVHGHKLGDPASLPCDQCRRALAADGFCEANQWGFDDGKMYATPLTWSLTKGRVDLAATDACAQCRSHARHHGWCDRCDAGQVGSFRFASHGSYDRAVRQQQRLALALRTLNRCEECAMRT